MVESYRTLDGTNICTYNTYPPASSPVSMPE